MELAEDSRQCDASTGVATKSVTGMDFRASELAAEVQETGVAVAPGVGFGEYGDQYIRLALVENEQRIRQAARNIKKFLAGAPSQGNVVPLAAAK